MLTGLDGDLELGADPVRCRDEQGVAEAGGLQVKQGPESAQGGVGTGSSGGSRQGLDAFHQGGAGVDIHTRLGVGETVLTLAHEGTFQ